VTLIEYRSGLISLLSLDARSAFSPDRTQTTVGAISHRRPIHLLNTVVVRIRPQTERATDSAICSLQSQRRTP
jgi:hypothetical protein